MVISECLYTYYVIKDEDKVRVLLDRAYIQVSLHTVLAPRYHEYIQVTIMTHILGSSVAQTAWSKEME